MTKEAFRGRCFEAFHHPVAGWAKGLNALIAALILFSVASAPLYLIPDFARLAPQLRVLEWVTALFFTVELVLRLWSAPKPLKYFFSWAGIIDIVAVLPFYFELIGVLGGEAHYFLGLRLLRILKLGRIYYVERLSTGKFAAENHGNFVPITDEKIEAVIYKHPIIFVLMLVPPLVFTSLGLIVLAAFAAWPVGMAAAVTFFAFALVYSLKAWLDFNYDVIYITNYRIIMQNRQLFGYQVNDIAYGAISNIRPDNTGLLRYLLGFGDVFVETHAASISGEFDHVTDPHRVVRLISENRQRALERGEGRRILAATQAELEQEKG
jgi:hypothetical protein